MTSAMELQRVFGGRIAAAPPTGTREPRIEIGPDLIAFHVARARALRGEAFAQAARWIWRWLARRTPDARRDAPPRGAALGRLHLADGA